ncbi:hypothetical protein CUC08_Gglean007998 [Alternaria sp. MG1]|jgi:hypothetical protein|uniref:uncharacterized protein n=1 Tax=Alternaria postmessia TaxID=1187938 RepID=UPI000EBF4351|nr:uncharacterized protein J4E82_009600 [Alternaria postmessia]KAI5371716.1 hypothetical protein J4E82_009600 [Alternaria postmessia]RII07030.1 hypothetical protein CUC08_Gglean007998 [Alternaria sp. MG1]
MSSTNRVTRDRRKRPKLEHKTTDDKNLQPHPVEIFSTVVHPDIAMLESETKVGDAGVCQAITARNQFDSPFLRLPSEIRNQIYNFALGDNEIYVISSGDQKSQLWGRSLGQKIWSLKPIKQIMAINLPLACTQIRHELGEYYAFTFNSFGAMTDVGTGPLLQQLTSAQRHRIEVLTSNYAYPIENKISYYEHIFTLVPNLKRLVLRDMTAMKAQEKKNTVDRIRAVCNNKEMEVEILDIC